MSVAPGTRTMFENWIKDLHKQFVESKPYQKLMNKACSREEVITFFEHIAKAHLRSGPILGFLFSIAPPESRHHIEHNLLEELGLENEGDLPHPQLLKMLGKELNLKNWQELENEAEATIRNKVLEPLMFGSMVEIGLSVMLEVIAFEWLLSREARKMGDALAHYLKVDEKFLAWFYHHSEVDIEHAEQGLDTLSNYVDYYKIDLDTVRNIAEITLRSNIFLKRYFDLVVEAQIK